MEIVWFWVHVLFTLEAAQKKTIDEQARQLREQEQTIQVAAFRNSLFNFRISTPKEESKPSRSRHCTLV